MTYLRSLLLVVFLASACLRAETSAPQPPRWVSSWVSAQQLTEPHNLPPAPGLAGHTLRQVIQPTLAGERLRLVFSNGYGEAPLTLTAVHVARSTGLSAIDPASDQVLTFGGAPTVTVLPGTVMVSDDVPFAVRPFENLAVTVSVAQVPVSITGHPGSRTTSFLQKGDWVSAPEMKDATRTDHWYLLAALDVLAEPTAAAIVVLGDSITDGRGSTTNQNDRWPNVLARRLHANPTTKDLAVLNQGAGGGRVLRDGLGTAALVRFDRDVIAVPGVRWLVIFEGVNDIGGTNGARAKGEPVAVVQELISAYRQMITRAHSHGIRVIGATIMPFGGNSYYTPGSEADRQAVNDWIRHGGEFDAVIDFDAITRDPSKPAQLSGEVDGGDHLHPSAAGYRIMAEAIDLALFAR